MTNFEGISVQEALGYCKATRLAHFTPARSLLHILRDGAIRSSKDLADDSPDHFDPTDKERFDRNPDKVCCTFQYPNGYYLAMARAKSSYLNYPDWICLFLDINLVLRAGTLFAPCNASKQSGAHLREGGDALLRCFSRVSDGWNRGPRHLQGAATNLQAEVLVPGPIDLSHFQALAVPTAEAAGTERARLDMLGVDASSLTWLVAPVLFDRNELSASVRNGCVIEEVAWTPPQNGAMP